jgi:hypothetical protein
LRYNVWLEIRDNFPWPAGEPGDDTEVQGKNRLNLGEMPDQVVVTSLFKSRKQGPRSYYLYSMYYDVETQAEMELSVQNLQWDNPGHVVILAGWNEDGSQIGTEHVWDTRIVTKTWSILNPDYQPDPELPDFDDRYVLRITGDVEEEYVSGYTGTPLYLQAANLIQKMPDVGDPPAPATELTDVNLGMGHPKRYFV